MQQRESSWSQWPTVLVLVCLTGGIAMGALAMWPQSMWPGPDAGIELPIGAPPHIPKTFVQAAPVNSQPEQPIERVVAPLPELANPPLVFAECVARLCDLGLRTAELAQDDEIDAAKRLDAQVRELLADLLQQFADTGERSLGMLIEMAGGPDVIERPLLENTKLGVLQLLLQSELSRRHQLAEKVHDRSRVDALVQAMLDAMPIGTLTAKMGDRCLHQTPFLRIVHEPSVLNLLKLASEDQFPREIATNMLLTLWDNVKASGERTSAELSQLALLRLDGGDPSQIVIACKHLLVDSSYRAVVLAWLRERNDRQLAADIAQLASQELPVRDALDVLRELAPLLASTRGVYAGLGIRAPEVLFEVYREHLAANNQPGIRRELIMGVGMLPDPAGLKLAELALANDPSPEVRIQAMYVFTVHASSAAAEQAINQLLDDPAIARSQERLAAVVLALHNLEHGDPNTIARLSVRLGSMGLAEYSRVSLNEILARALPGGGAGIQPGGG